MFDTHCHLNFSRFKKNVEDVIQRAVDSGVTQMVVPGTDVATSKKAIEVAEKYEGVYAAVGIHPHHVFEFGTEDMASEINLLKELLKHPKAIAVGEVGMDRHIYENTKYAGYQVDKDFIGRQEELFSQQVKLAVMYSKTLIIHNRETKNEVSVIMRKLWDPFLSGRSVFHCCEPDPDLLRFARDHRMFIGVDGDLTYRKDKQDFIKTVPLEMLVLETDSPFLLPEPLKSAKKYPNEPANLNYIVDCLAGLLAEKPESIKNQTSANAQLLFGLD